MDHLISDTYCMDGLVEKNDNRIRTSASIHLWKVHATARRTNGTDVSRPSIVSCTISPTSATVKSINTTTKTNYFPSGYTTNHHSKPSLEHILWLLSQPTDGTFTWRKIQAEGMVEDWQGRIQWIRKATKKREMKSHLDELESNKLVRIKSELERIILFFDRDTWPNGFTPHADVAHTERNIRQICRSQLQLCLQGGDEFVQE